MTTVREPTQMRPGFKQPPHSREAEESVLGAILLSSDAVNEVMDRIHPEDFYVPAHQAIFEAVRQLFDTSQAIDAVTVSEELRRKGELDKVGGVQYLTRLVDIVPSTSNIVYYAGIVEEHAKRRELIRAGASVTEYAFEIDDAIADVLDRAEQAVLGVAERRSSQNLLEVGPMFQDVLERIELLEQQGSEVTGLATGFVDLDKKLAGLQNANLVIIAGRPGSGKSSLALNIATNAASDGEPVAIFSLEMSKEEIVQRILSSVGKVDSMKLRSGQLGPLWQRVVDAAGKMYKAPIYIDDSPVVRVTDIRAKCRRLKRKGGLSLIVVDYLQLMEADGENRQQEISAISRNLKNLARELEVPILAASQLNRSVETREDKRPRLADLRESGCLTADTRLIRADTNAEVTLGELVESGARDVPVWSLDENYRLIAANLTHAFPSGIKPTYEIRLASGRVITGTDNHPFLTLGGWTPLGDLVEGDRIAAARLIPEPTSPAGVLSHDQIVLLGHMIGDGCHLARHALQYTTTDLINADIVAEAARRAFGIEARLKRERQWYQLYLPAPDHLTHGRRNPMAAWLDELGLFDKRSYEKFVPEPVFSMSRFDTALFLRHLWATDGSVWSNERGGRIYYATSSRQLALDVQSLLTRLDIRSRITVAPQTSGRDQFNVTVSGRDDQLAFLEGVGVAGTRGVEAAVFEDRLEGVIANTNVDTIPSEIWDHVRYKAMPSAGVTARELADRLGMSYCGSTLYRSSVGRSRMARLAAALDDPFLDALAHSDVLWDRVVSITPKGEQAVFDATIDGTHNFLANGIIAHNSIEQDADVVMFVYRHEMYHPEDQENKGIAEILIAKHRAGSIGPVKMTFQEEFTRFANLGRDVS